MAYIGNKPGSKYATLTRQTFSTPTGTSHTLSQTVTNSDDLLLYINNVKQNPADYTASGTTLTTASLAGGTEMYCLYYGKTTETVAVPASSVGDSHMVDMSASKLTGAMASGVTGVGKIVQVVNEMDTAVATGTTAMPDDDTIPQISEGDEYLSVAITPTSASNKLLIQVIVNGDCSGEKVITAALFQDSTAGALAGTQSARDGATNDQHQIAFNHYMAAGTTSATTFRVRAGGASNTFTLNGHSSGRLLGGVNASSLTVMEIAV